MHEGTAEGSAKTIESLTKNLLECYEELDLIYRLSGRLMATLDVQKNVELILHEAMDIFGADLGWMRPAGDETCLFRPVTAGADPEVMELLDRRLVSGLVAAGKSRMFYGLRRELEAGDAVPDSFLCAVLKTEQAVYGVLCVGRHDGGNMFTAGDQKLANVLASQAAIALENCSLNRRRIEEEEALIRMQEEIRLALEIQTRLLPKSAPALAGYDIAGRSLPALGVGGDYFDFIAVDDRRLAVCLGDVAGKGMPAALLMANLQASVRGQTLMGAAPAECLGHSNTLLVQGTDPDKFATCFYGILDAREHRLRYANAGHERPLLFSRGGAIDALDTGGLVLGVLPGVAFPEASVELQSGDLLLLYSDGITEAVDGEDREFGVQPLYQVIASHPEATAAEMLDHIMEAVETHAGGAPPSDDRTLVVIRRL